MAAVIIMDAGVPVAGSIEVAAGTPIVLSNQDDTGVLGWQWTLLDKPPLSIATVSTPNAATSSITPDVPGTYLIRLETFTDVPRTILDDTDEQAAGVRYVGFLTWRLPAAGEIAQFNIRGWTGEINDILDETRTQLQNSQGDVEGPGSSTDNRIVRWDGVTGTLIQDSNIGITDNGDLTDVETITLLEQPSAPTPLSDSGIIYTRDISGNTELHYVDSDGNEVQVTTNGVLNVPVIKEYNFVFDPTVVSADNVFATWAEVIAALATSEGIRTVLVRLPSGSETIPEQNADLTGVLLIGRPEDRQAGRQLIFTTANTAWSNPPVYVENLNIRKNSGSLLSSGVYSDISIKNCTLTADTGSIFTVTGTGSTHAHLYGDTLFFSVNNGSFVNAGASATANIFAHTLGVTFDFNFAAGTANRVTLYYMPGITVAGTTVSYVRRQLGWEHITPTALSAHTNDYSPSGWSDARFVRISATAAWQLSGFAANVAQPFKWIINVGVNNITLMNNTAPSTAVNRIITHTGSNLVLEPNEAVFIYYDTVDSRWRTLDFGQGSGGGGGGGGGGDVVGPGSSTDNAIVRFDGVLGTAIQNTNITIDDNDEIDGVISTRYEDRGSAPAGIANTGIIYVKVVSGVTELFYVDSAGVEVQITSGGIVTGTGAGGGGWLRVVDIQLQGSGSVTNKVYDDPGNTIIQSATVSNNLVRLSIECSYPNITVNAVPAVLARSGTIYTGLVNITIAGSGTTVIECQAIDSDGELGAIDTVEVTIEAPPEILTLAFAAQAGGPGGAVTYPGLQTELKAGDTVRIEGTTDKLANAIECLDFEACGSQVVVFGASTSFSVFVTIANRGITTQDLAARVRARDAVSLAYGNTRDTDFGGGTTDGVHLVKLNNRYPTINSLTGIGTVTGHAFSITYPGSQTALKGAESATVVNTASDYDTITYSAPLAQLSIANTTTFENPKSVSRIAGSYNVSSDNFQISANRAANNATKTVSGVVAIADADQVITVSTPAARLRSGGNNGTSVQSYTITISSTQQLLNAPSLAPEAGGNKGTFTGGGFTGGPTAWTRSFSVSELVPDLKGTFNWASLVTTNRAGKVVTVITTGATYTLGGFVARTLTFGPFSSTTTINTTVVDFSKLTAGTFTSTAGAALKQPIGTPPSVTNGYTIDATGIDPTTLIWLDTPAVNSNSSGTATITNVQETV